MRVDLAGIGGSALTDTAIPVPEQATSGIPVTYVPARNTMLLSLALGWAEVLAARDIFIGVNAVDYSGYPGLPAGVHRRVRAARDAGDQGGRRRQSNPRARPADHADQGRHHPRG